MGEQAFVVGQRVRCKTWYDPDEVGLISAIEQGEAHPYLIVYEDGEYISVGGDVLIPADPPPAQAVAEWQDISGNDHALSQSGAEHQPVIVPSPPEQPDDERQFEALEVAYVEATAGILKDDMTLAEWERARSERQGAADALIIAMQKRLTALNARLDAVQAERDAAVKRLSQEYNDANA